MLVIAPASTTSQRTGTEDSIFPRKITSARNSLLAIRENYSDRVHEAQRAPPPYGQNIGTQCKIQHPRWRYPERTVLWPLKEASPIRRPHPPEDSRHPESTSEQAPAVAAPGPRCPRWRRVQR